MPAYEIRQERMESPNAMEVKNSTVPAMNSKGGGNKIPAIKNAVASKGAKQGKNITVRNAVASKKGK